MAVEVPPGGTHGTRMPSGAMARIGARIFAAMYRRFPDRIMGGELLILTTVGAKSGEKRVASVRRFADGNDK